MSKLELVPFSAFKIESRPEILRAIIYTRVSRLVKGSTSPEQQEGFCRKYIASQGWPLHPRVYTDPGISASKYATKHRNDYPDLLKELRKGDVLVVWEDNRLARNMDDALELRNLCVKIGCYLAYSGRVFDMSVTSDKSAFTKDAQRSEEYSDNLQASILRGLRTNAEEGKPAGVVPFGFRICRDEDGNPEPKHDENGGLWYREAHPKEAPIVRELFERFANGEKVADIAADFAEQKKFGRRGKVLLRDDLDRYLRNAAYAGICVSNGESVSVGLWEPLVTTELFQACEEITERAAKKFKHTGGIPKAHLLSGLVTCSVCGDKARVYSKSIYKCFVRHDHSVSRSKEFLEQYVQDVFLGKVSDPKFVRETVELLSANAGDTTAYDRLIEEARELEEYVESYRKSALDPKAGVSPGVVAAVERENMPKIKALRSQAEDARSRIMGDDPLLDLLLEADPAYVWYNVYPTELKRAILGQALYIEIRPCGKTKEYRLSTEQIGIRWIGTEDAA